MESPRALAVEPEVLGEGLRDAELEPLLDEVPNGPGVAFEVARREPLVGAVEKREEVSLPRHRGDLFPLVAGGVHAGGVVRAGVQEDDAAGGRGGEGGKHAAEVEGFGRGVEVWV